MSIQRSLIFSLVGASMFLFYSCNTCNRPEKLPESDDKSVYLKMGQNVLSKLPTPIEASMLIKDWILSDWGDPTKDLNDPANASGYLTKKKMALNFGVYLTDITTAGLNDQTQVVMNYKQALMLLIDGLGLKAAIDQQIMQKIEDNRNNKDELIKILSDLYEKCTEFLSDDDRDFYALAIISGGWVEGMYIATNMIDENQTSNVEKMKHIVNDNKLTFDLLWSALGNFEIIPEEAMSLMIEMSYVAHLFGHETDIGLPQNAYNIDNFTPKFFAELKNHVSILRQQFVKK